MLLVKSQKVVMTPDLLKGPIMKRVKKAVNYFRTKLQHFDKVLNTLLSSTELSKYAIGLELF